MAIVSSKRTYDWAALPCDIISSIFEYLDDFDVDRRRAASVCTAWHRICGVNPKPTTMKLPFICTCVAFDNNLCQCADLKYYSLLRQTSYYFIISPLSMGSQTRVSLIRAEKIEGNKWLILHPSSWKDDYCLFHHQSPASSRPEYSFNLLDDYKILDVARLHTLHHVIDFEDSPIGHSYFSWTMPFVRKVVPLPDLEIVLLLFDSKGRLALWSEYAQWTFINTGNYQFDDVVYHQGQLYAIDTAGKLVCINPTSLDLSEIASCPPAVECDVKVMNLVCSEGCLYLVYKGFAGVESSWCEYIRSIRRGSWVENRPLLSRECKVIGEPKDVGVFIFNKQDQSWEKVESLGDRVFFVADYVTFSICARDLGWKEGNFIYFICKDFGNGPGLGDNRPDLGDHLDIYKVEGNVCTKQKDLPSNMTVQFWPPPPGFALNENK